MSAAAPVGAAAGLPAAAAALASAPAAAAARATAAWGGFRVAGLHLALPMEALCEVVPCVGTVLLPGRGEGLVGGVDVRGDIIPLLDLRVTLGLPASAQAGSCVVVMLHEGRVLGLLADGVTGVFEAPPHAAGSVRVAAGGEPLFSGFVHDPGGRAAAVLSPAAIASLPGVPMVRRAHGTQAFDGAAVAATPGHAMAATGLPMLVLRCGSVLLAIEATAVHSTLLNPRLMPSALSGGACRGTVSVAGRDLPALDLLTLCGLGALQGQGALKGFVTRAGGGLVALLVDQVVEIVTTQPGDRLPLPAWALSGGALLSGVLPSSVCPAVAGGPPLLVLDVAAMQADERLASLGSTNARDPAQAPADQVAAALHAGGARAMLTYELGTETATPLSQVTEILPCAAVQAVFGGERALLGMLVHRQRSIPLLCLGMLTGSGPAARTPAASVLLVDDGDERVGFVVPRLQGIEPACWEPPARAAGTALEPMVLVGSGPQQRMLRMLDLQALVRRVRTQGLPAG